MLKRTLGITATAAAISIAAILPAGAQTSPGGLDSYAAGATARALDLSVFGEEAFTLADTFTEIASTPGAVAKGSAVFTTLAPSSGDSVTAGTAPETAQSCAELPVALPEQLQSDVVCIDMNAKVVDGNPIGSSRSHEFVIEIKVPSQIGTTPLNIVVEQVKAGLGDLFDALVPVTEQLPPAIQSQLDDIVNGLIGQVQAGGVLARITVAPTSSASQFDATGVVANAASNGVIVELLPNLPGGALAVATVGTATSSVVRDAVTGEVTTNAGGESLINITYPNGLLGGLKVLTDELDGALGTLTAQLPCSDANPLAQVICFDLGTATELDAAGAKAMGFDYGPTTVGYASSVLDLRLFAADATMGGVILKVGETAAAASATTSLPGDPKCIEHTGDPDCPDTSLPRTGGSSTLPITMALLGAGAAGAALLRRSRTI